MFAFTGKLENNVDPEHDRDPQCFPKQDTSDSTGQVTRVKFHCASKPNLSQ